MADQVEKPCHLLELPAELRETIYRMVLVAPLEDPIQVDSDGYDREGLLSTCKQIRSEAIDILYEESYFMVNLPDFSPEIMVKLQDCYRAMGVRSPLRHYRSITAGEAHWPNLLQHLKYTFELCIPGIGCAPGTLSEKARDENLERSIIMGMFNLVYST